MRERFSDLLDEQVSPGLRVGIVIAIPVIGLLAVVLYGVKPAFAEYRKVNDDFLQAASGQEALPLEGQRQIDALETELRALRESLFGGSSAVPRRQIESFVIDSLDRLAGSHRVQLLGVEPEQPAQLLMFEELPFSIRVSGGYADLYGWLTEAENALRPMVVKQFSMVPARDRSSVTMELRLVAYRTPDAETPQ